MKPLRIIPVIIALVAGITFFQSCSKENTSPAKENTGVVLKTADPCECNVYPLMAGQTLDWGSVTIYGNNGKIYVKYEITLEGFWISNLHLWIGTDENGFPKNNQGVPVPGLFPYFFTPTNTTTTEYTFEIPYGEVNGADCEAALFYMAHATITNGTISNTAWGASGGMKYAKNMKSRWYYEVNDLLCCDNTTCENYDHETAYAGNSGLIGTPWFYYFNVDGTTQDIFAGQYTDIGSAYISNGVLYITLEDGWEFQPVAENLKIQGDNTVPTARGKVGQYAEKSTQTGTTAEVTLNTPLSTYYRIHLDVRHCTGE